MPYPPSYYQLTPAELADNNYPVPVLDADSGELRCPPGFVVTQPAGNGIAKSPVHEMLVRPRPPPASQASCLRAALHTQALDCEMCYTATGLEVTRCSVVDSACAVVYDSLVLPDSPILDYNTAHSGITAELMSGVTTRLADVQAHLLEIVAEETLLVR
jgi:RNA exonuclease 1